MTQLKERMYAVITPYLWKKFRNVQSKLKKEWIDETINLIATDQEIKKLFKEKE